MFALGSLCIVCVCGMYQAPVGKGSAFAHFLIKAWETHSTWRDRAMVELFHLSLLINMRLILMFVQDQVILN